MLVSLTRRVLFLTGWLSLAYLGYWLALAIERALAQLVLFPLLGAAVSDWRLTPFQLNITNAPFPREVFWYALPLLLQIVFAVGTAQLLPRSRSQFLRILLSFAAFWTMLFLAYQAALFVLLSRGTLARVAIALAGSSAFNFSIRVIIAIFAAAFLLLLGRSIARYLLDCYSALEFHSAWPTKFLAVLWTVLPFQLILVAAVGVPLRFLGLRLLLFLGIPGAFSLLIVLLALLRKEPCIPSGRLESPAAASAFGLALAAAFCFQYASAAQLWFQDRNLARFLAPHCEIAYNPAQHSAEAIRRFADEREAAFTRIVSRLALPLDDPSAMMRIRVVLYPDLIAKRDATNSDHAYSVEGTLIRAVLADGRPALDPSADAQALLHAAWGPPGNPMLREWIACLLAGEWRGRTPAVWAAQITREVGSYSLADLLADDRFLRLSPLVRTPLGAAWAQQVQSQFGWPALRKLYLMKAQPLDISAIAAALSVPPAQLEDNWRNGLQAVVTSSTNAPAPGSALRRPLDAGQFFRGVSFTHEGFGGRGGGYISREAMAQLRLLRDLGVNAISVVPYGFLRELDGDAITFAFTDETDEELAFALHAAHKLQMKVMLKPQIWVGRGQFTGEIRIADPAARQRWFRSYREFALHYARLAELEGFDLLCIGNELGGMTVHETEWRTIIADARRVFHGPITYAANWGAEFETLHFWDALDFAGLNNYYPLRTARSGSPPADSSLMDLQPGARSIAEKLEAFYKKWRTPILFTEIGYPSLRGGAAEPWIEDPARGISLDEQAAAYEAVFRSVAGKPWLRGMFWWKWLSHGRGGGPLDPTFTPVNKPAAEVLRSWYSRLAGPHRDAPSSVPAH